MNATKCYRTWVKTSYQTLKSVGIATLDTTSAIVTSCVAGFATLSIYAKGAPRKS